MEALRTWLGVAILVLGGRWICAGEPPRCSAWELVNPSPQANHLRDVAHGGGRWVAVGEGVAVTSTDGSTWSAAPLPGASLRGVAYGNGRFVAVGTGGVILRFANGVTWESAEPPTTSDLAAVAFAGGRFLAVGVDTTVLSSSDGLAWTSEHPVELQGDLLGVRESGAFNGNPGPMFLVWSSASIALRRLDGTWVAIAVPPGAAVAESVFWASGSILSTFSCSDCGWCWAYGTCFHETHDGINWTTPYSSLNKGPYDVTAKGTGLIGLVWNEFAELSYLWRSPDGLSWHPTSMGFNVRPHALASAAGVFVAVGDFGAIWTSTNNTGWSSVSPTVNLFRAISNGRVFVANGAFGAPGAPGFAPSDGSLLVSSDGRAWTAAAAGDIDVVAARPGLFLGVRGNETYSSTDGLEWVANEPLPTWGAPGAVWDGRRFLILSWGSSYCRVDPCLPSPVFAATSDDLSEWIAVEQPGLLGDSLRLIGMAFNGERYVAPGGWSWSASTPYVTRVSEDGLNWRSLPAQFPITTGGRTGVVSDGRGFLVVNGAAVLLSPDGLAWSSVDIAPLHLIGVMWTGSEYVGVGDDGAGRAAIAYSADGTQWTSESFPAIPARLLSIAGGQRVQLAVGQAGLTLRRECHPQSPSRRLRGAR